MGGILCPPPQELWPLGMAATYTIPEKIKFDDESLQALSDANISPGSRFSLSNIRAEVPTNNSCARMQCLRALCSVEDIHLRLLTLGDTSNISLGKGTTFSLNFTYSTGSEGCQIQFFVYSKVKGRKKGKNAVGDIVDRAIYTSPWLNLPAQAKKKNFSSSEHNISILASKLPTYLHYRKYIHPSIYDIVLVVTKPGYVDPPATGGGVGGGLVRLLSTRSIGEGIKGEASAPATRRGPPTNGSVLPSLYYSSVVAPSPGPSTPTPSAPPAKGNVDFGKNAVGDHFIYVDKQVYFVNMSVSSLQAHLESLGRDINADNIGRETGAVSDANEPAGAAAVPEASKARKKKHKAAKRAKASSSSAEVASRDLVGTEGLFSVSPDRVQPVVGKGKGTNTSGVVSYAILNNRNSNEGPGEGEGVADEDAGVEEEEEEEEEVATDSRFNILKSVLMGGGDTPTYFKPSQEDDQAFSPPTVQPAEPATPPVSTPIATPTATPTSTKLKSHHHHSHHHSRQQQGAVHSPPIIQGNHLLASPTSPTSPVAAALPSSVTWTIAMEIKEHRYTLPAGGGDRMYLAKAIYDLKYHVGSSGSGHGGAPMKENAGNETKQANIEGNSKAAGGTKKIITFPSLPYISKTGPGQNIHQTPVRGFDEKSASLILGGDGEESHDLPDFVTKKEEGALQDTTGECVLYIQNSLNETANSTPKCPVCRENIALLVHIV
eukprot:gene24964-30160_t